VKERQARRVWESGKETAGGEERARATLICGRHDCGLRRAAGRERERERNDCTLAERFPALFSPSLGNQEHLLIFRTCAIASPLPLPRSFITASLCLLVL